MSPSSDTFEWIVPSDDVGASGGYAGGAMFPESVDAVGRLVRQRRADPNPPKGDLLDRMLDYRDEQTGIAFDDNEVIGPAPP